MLQNHPLPLLVWSHTHHPHNYPLSYKGNDSDDIYHRQLYNKEVLLATF